MVADPCPGWRPAPRAATLSICAAALSLCAAAAALADPARGTLERCATCHGADGNATIPGIPSLAGQPALFVETQLVLFREGLRPSPVMGPEMTDMDDATIVALARHFQTLRPRPPPEGGDPALLERGASLARAGHCGGCHLPDFSGHDQIPRLAGQREDYLRATLTDYREQRRIGAETVMIDIMSPFSDADIEALAHFLSRQG